MTYKSRFWIPALVAATLAVPMPSMAEEGKFDLGVRFDIGLGSGEPANDIIGYGLFGHYKLNERWNVGFAVDYSPEFDFERTPDVLGLATPEVFDAKGTSTTCRAGSSASTRVPKAASSGFGVGVSASTP